MSVLDHKWLDPDCNARGCQSLVLFRDRVHELEGNAPRDGRMPIDTAVKRIIDNWDDWQAEAGHEAQVQQDPRAGELVLEGKLRFILEKVAS